jgi:hypothetical protein
VIAMWIVSPADKKGSRSNFPDTVSNDSNRPFGPFAFIRNKTIGKTEEKHLLRFQPKLEARLSCLLFTQRCQPVGRIGSAVRMRAGAVADNDDLSSHSLPASVGDQASAGQALIVGMRGYDDNGRASSISRKGRKGNECAAARTSPTVIATGPARPPVARAPMPPRRSARDRDQAGEDRSRGLVICAR